MNIDQLQLIHIEIDDLLLTYSNELLIMILIIAFF